MSSIGLAVEHDGGTATNPYDARRERRRGRKGFEEDLTLWKNPQQPPPPKLAPGPGKTPNAVHAGFEPPHLTEAQRAMLERLAWRSLPTARLETDLERRFRELAKKWHKETRFISSVTKMVTHPAYLRIIGMGPAAVPLLLRELERTRDHWFVALHAITGEDPAPPRASFDEAVEAWLAWGKRNGYI